ncbi:MAG: tRNA preQ1(34) S-adenosylmethionine ribosyltransferase-isomerase QueA [Caldilineaceae bacterium]|nr:tRNA preQ1(34) S-adenosylmethionine ribosyltransferase-isomerase QueA [Caldilineaceae bacterium]
MLTSAFDYNLPERFIAQQPAEPRDSSRLLVLHREDGRLEHRRFHEIGEFLSPDDLLTANDSRVIPARLFGHKVTGGKVEIFLLAPQNEDQTRWECLTRGRNLQPGVEITLGNDNAGLTATIVEVTATGSRLVDFSAPVTPYLDALGEIPLPPYITDYQGDRERYQTIYSRPEGSVAAPTAGLHFTPDLLVALREQGVGFDTVTLHVGLDTFKPVEAEAIDDHVIHSEWATLSAQTARHINDVTLQGGRIVAVGTTATRTLEYAATGAQGIDPYDNRACPWQRTAAFAGAVDLFIRPGYRFRAVDALITNFHLPRSSLLMLVSAFIGQAHPDDPDAGRRILLESYEVAKQEGYRFYSFGDAMLIV